MDVCKRYFLKLVVFCFVIEMVIFVNVVCVWGLRLFRLLIIWVNFMFVFNVIFVFLFVVIVFEYKDIVLFMFFNDVFVLLISVIIFEVLIIILDYIVFVIFCVLCFKIVMK